MWSSMPPWGLAIIPAVPFGALVLLQSVGASKSLQNIAFILCLGAILVVIYLIRVRKRSAPPMTVAQSPKKMLLGFGQWLIAVFILALLWANGHVDWGLAALGLWVIAGVTYSLIRK